MLASHLLAFALGAVAAIILVVVAGGAMARWWRGWTHKSSLRAHKRFGTRIDRFKLADRATIITSLLENPDIAAAVRAHAAEHGVPEAEAWAAVRRYLHEIVPAFSLWFYYHVGVAIADAVLKLFFRVVVIDKGERAAAQLPKDAVVIYLFNHRSNADYVVAAHALAGQVALSYAVGEWARVFPLEYLFKAFGGYFVRRRFREPLYHVVLEQYVQLITRNGVTQGIFPEGGLTRDGRFRPAKVGLLDYIIGVARDPAVAERAFVVPVAINYDRVLEDRSLLRELRPEQGHRPPPRVVQFSIVLWYVAWNAFRMVTGRWKRLGDAVIVLGEPVPLAPWFSGLRERGRDLFALDRHARLGEVQGLADDAMRRIGDLMPVPAAPLVCAAIQSLDAEYIPRARLLDRVEELRQTLVEEGRYVMAPEAELSAVVDRGIELLWIRRAVARSRDGVVVLPNGRELVSYYANTIAHLLGEFETAVRARDALPVYAVVDL